MVTHPSVPAQNISEFIAYAKANPGKLNYASLWPGSGLHFAGEVFKSMAGIDMVHVPYKVSGPGMIDVLAGKVRFLGTTSAVRDPRYSNTPTIDEAGVNGYNLTYWVGLMGPKGLSTEVT